MYAIHTISHHDGRTFRGLHVVDRLRGEYRSESWSITDGNPRDLVGGWLYFHDSSYSRATFAAQIIDVIAIQGKSPSNRVAFRILRSPTAGQPWRGRTPSQRVPHGGIVPATFDHEKRMEIA